MVSPARGSSLRCAMTQYLLDFRRMVDGNPLQTSRGAQSFQQPRLFSNNHQVHSWGYSHVKLVFVFVGCPEPMPLVEMTCGILNNRKGNSF
jgi:hypothetical protein